MEPGQYVRDAVPFAGVRMPFWICSAFRKRGWIRGPHPVDGVQMVVMPVGLTFLRVDVLPQSGVEVGSLQIVGGQRVARQHGMDKAACDEPGKALRASWSKAKAGPITQTTLPWSRSWRSSS